MSGSDDDGDELVGFQEFIQDNKPAVAKKKKGKNRDQVQGPEMVTFIEDEISRLSRLSEFFDKKLQNSITFSPTEELIRKQDSFNILCRERLANNLTKLDSEFQKNLKNLFENHFKELS